jgi:hypothetical protein
MPYDSWLQALLPHFKEAFSKALEELLQEKNLCQSVAIDQGFIKTWAFAGVEERGRDFYQGGGDRRLSHEQNESAGAHILNARWYPDGCGVAAEEPYSTPGSRMRYEQAYSFSLPQIRRSCPECLDRTIYKADLPRCRFVAGKEPGDEQTLLLSYECQGCLNQRAKFLVTRKGDRLRLSGRDALEILPVPFSVPTVVSDYFAEAQIAHQSGQNLSSFVMLREFIEQFWRSLPEMQEPLSVSSRMTPTEIGECYAAQLPLEFKAQYPSLTDCYRWLCDAIHGSPMRRDIFEFCLRDIVEHLDGRRFRRLTAFNNRRNETLRTA